MKHVQAIYRHKEWQKYVFNPNAHVAAKSTMTMTAKNMDDDVDMDALEEEAKRVTPKDYEFVKLEETDI